MFKVPKTTEMLCYVPDCAEMGQSCYIINYHNLLVFSLNQLWWDLAK